MTKTEMLKREIASYLWQYRNDPPTSDLEVLRRASFILTACKEAGLWFKISYSKNREIEL